jgi:hypothetical protein
VECRKVRHTVLFSGPLPKVYITVRPVILLHTFSYPEYMYMMQEMHHCHLKVSNLILLQYSLPIIQR